MGIMTAGTVILLYRSVTDLVLCQEILHVHQVTGRARIFPVMTTHAEIGGLHG